MAERPLVGRFYLGLVPWLVFTVVARSEGHGVVWAGLAALVTAIVIAIPSVRSGSPKVLDLGAIVLFAGLALAGQLAPDHSDFLDRYGRALAMAGMAVIAFGSLAFDPLFGEYARDAVPPRQWGTADFRRGNELVTVMWGLAALAMAGSHAIAGLIDTRAAATLFHWIVPIAVVVGAVHQTMQRSHEYFYDDLLRWG